MKVRLSALLLAIGAMSSPAFAQTGVAGKWTGELSAAAGRGAVQPITVELKLEGESLSGTVTEGALEARPIVGASMNGGNVSFRTVRNLGGGDININWRGEIKGDDMALTREIGPAPPEAGGGGRGGGRGGAAAGAGGRGGGRGAAAPAAGGQRGGDAAAAAPAIPPVPAAAGGDATAAAGGRGGAARGGGGRGGGAPGGAAAAPAVPNPTVTLTLHRAK